MKPLKQCLAISALLLAVPLVLGGCRVRAEPVDPAVSVTYTPMRYRGQVVYYEDGEPYYVVRDRRFYIQRNDRDYDRYRRHYQRYHRSPQFESWHRNQRRDRDVRRPAPRRGPHYADPRRHH